MSEGESKKVSITIPSDLLSKLKQLSGREHRSLSGVLQEAARYYVRIREFEDLQLILSKRARELGILDEDDLEELLDSSQ